MSEKLDGNDMWLLEKVARLSDKELAEVDKHFTEIVKIIEAKE